MPFEVIITSAITSAITSITIYTLFRWHDQRQAQQALEAYKALYRRESD